ncbi:DUF6230 family protein [Catenulispora rubra]|uniref:DUF6230 family protein n=1 Tax=Catenulispora rubra TaxID=280293 RepID=UPI001E2A9E1A|nr:DUF6230 family protein [Catenulispora rubra]
MKDAMGAQVLGGTKWKRFALVMVPTVGIAGALTVSMAQGVLATSFAVSGQPFKVTASELDGTNFIQSGDIIPTADGKAHAVAVAGISKATISQMCQSVDVPLSLPLMGTVHLTIVLKAGQDKGNPVTASNLVLDTNQVNTSEADFTGVNIGASAADVDAKYKIPGWQKHDSQTGKPTNYAGGDFAQVVDNAVLKDVKQTAYSTTAGTMTLPGLSISANLNGIECY